MNHKELRCMKITDRRLITELKDFDISCLPSAEFLFLDMESLIEVPESFSIRPYTTSIEGVFADCHNLLTIPELDLKHISNASLMCYNCKKIQKVYLSSKNVNNMDSSFSGCSELKSISLDIENLKTARNIFDKCFKLKSITLRGDSTTFDKTIDLTDVQLSYTALIRLLKSLPKYTESVYSSSHPTLELSNMKSADKLSLDDISMVYNKGWRINKKGDLRSE